MKKLIILASLALMMASCEQSNETKLSQYFVKYEAEYHGRKCVGVRDIRDPEGMPVVSEENGYEDVEFHYFCFLGKRDDGVYELLDINGDMITEGDRVEKHDDCILISDHEYTSFYSSGGALCGPADTFEYYPAFEVVFTSNENGIGAYNTYTGEPVVEMRWNNVVLAVDEDDEAFYVSDGRQYYRCDKGALTPISKKDIREMKQDAEDNDTPWPMSGYAVVRVDQLL